MGLRSRWHSPITSGPIALVTAALAVVGVMAPSVLATSASAAPRSGPAPQSVSAFYVQSAAFAPIPFLSSIAGIDRTPNGEYVMIAADAPARYFDARLPFTSGAGAFGRVQASILPRPVLGPGLLPLLPGSAQFEGIRSLGSGFVVVSGGAQEFVRILGALGNQERDLPLPAAYRSTARSGLDARRGLTGVAVAPGSGRISVLTAGGLKQDPAHSARLLSWVGRGTREFVYRTDGDTAAADVLAINATDYLVLERGRGRATRVYWTTTRGAQPVTGVNRLSGREKAMPKNKAFSTAPLSGLHPGDVSGLAWGNWLPDLPWQNFRARILFMVTRDGAPRVHAVEVHLPRR